MAKVLVTGGAGYIGSHVVRQLGEAGHVVLVVDDLSTGHAQAVLHGELVVADCGDEARMRSLLEGQGTEAVLHFAARTVVPDSVRDPLGYYLANTCKTRSLLTACAAAGVGAFLFSSTAAVYGHPPGGRAAEDGPTEPINPYGASKLMSERMLRDLAAAGGPRYGILRYFNVAGADPQGRIGQATPRATHLIKVACEAAVGKREAVEIYGTDYDTPDGTCIRDYIHVEDLARAHVLALERLLQGGEPFVLNCGYGRGHSVREVLETVQRVHGRPLRLREGPRRPGDPPVLVAEARRIREALGWEPRHEDLEAIVASALAWERRLQAGRPWGAAADGGG